MNKIIPFAGALIATLAFILAGGGALPGGVRLQVPNTASIGGAPVADAHVHDAGAAPAAPEPIVPPAGGSTVAITTARADKIELGYSLSVKVTSPAGKPVSEATIRFYDVVDLFGQREELIGTAVTDGQGSGLIYYLPASTGTHKIVARFAGQGTLAPSLGVTDLEAAVAAPTYKVDPQPLAAFSRYVPFAAGALVLSVWALIAFSLIGTARGVLARANETPQKGEPA
ncbi:MAG TPA: hypothetical protein VEU77_04050 [Candidatus Acidoferrales bacterium]|nr:hypothetical protein [Candidatus Acidoferrales bacterium]